MDNSPLYHSRRRSVSKLLSAANKDVIPTQRFTQDIPWMWDAK